MDRVGLDDIEREIDAEARERFPGGAVRQVVLLQYGDDPEIEPGDLWVRVLLAADGPGDYDRAVREFQRDHEAAMEEFAGHLARKLREIMLVEFTCASGQHMSGSASGSRRSISSGEISEASHHCS